MRKLRQFKIILQLAALLGLAALWPDAERVVLSVFPAKAVAVAVIFFVTGVSLETRNLFKAVGSFKIHAFIQAFSFVLFPLLVSATHFPLDAMSGGQLTIGLYALACVPTTMSSCVVFTMLAGGNRAVALLNAVAGNLMGLVLSPLLFVALARAGQVEVDIDKLLILRKIGTLVVLPFVAGQICPARITSFFCNRKRLCAGINESAILMVVFFSFCSLFRMESHSLTARHLLLLAAYLVAVHLATLGAVVVSVPALRVSREDRIAATFTAPQKTLAFGLPLIMVFCAKTPDISPGLVSLPLILYHSIQLVVSAFVKDRLLQKGSGQKEMKDWTGSTGSTG